MTPLTAHPLWSRIFAASSTVADATANVIAYARAFAAAAVAQRTQDEEDSRSSVLRFEEAADITAPANNDPVAVADAAVHPDASFADHLTSCATKVFHTPSLRRDQPAARELVRPRTDAGECWWPGRRALRREEPAERCIDRHGERSARPGCRALRRVNQRCLGRHVGCRANLVADRIAEEASKRWLDWQGGRGRAAEHRAVDRAERRLD